MDLSVRINNQGLWILVTVDLVSVFEVVIVMKTNVSHPCSVTVSSCTSCFLSWSLFVLFHLPIPTDSKTVLAEYTLLLTKVEELHFYCVDFPLPLFLCMEKYNLTSALFSWQERWVAPVCWPAIIPCFDSLLLCFSYLWQTVVQRTCSLNKYYCVKYQHINFFFFFWLTMSITQSLLNY